MDFAKDPVAQDLEIWDGQTWEAVNDVNKAPEKPAGSQWNSATLEPVNSDKLCIVFTNNGNARSGVTEVMLRNEAAAAK